MCDADCKELDFTLMALLFGHQSQNIFDDSLVKRE